MLLVNAGELEGVVARNNLIAQAAAGGAGAAASGAPAASASSTLPVDLMAGLGNLVVTAPMPTAGSGALRSPVLVSSPVRLHPPRSPMAGAPGASAVRLSGVDDVRMVMKDKSRRAAAGILAAAGKPSSRSRHNAGGANGGVSDSHWDERERGTPLRSRNKSSAASGAATATNTHGLSVADDEHDQVRIISLNVAGKSPGI